MLSEVLNDVDVEYVTLVPDDENVTVDESVSVTVLLSTELLDVDESDEDVIVVEIGPLSEVPILLPVSVLSPELLVDVVPVSVSIPVTVPKDVDSEV